MCAIVGRLFLLVLLACDWAADPSLLAPAVQGLAAPFASTVCFCHSVVHRAALYKACTAARDDATRRPGPRTRPPRTEPPAPTLAAPCTARVPFLSLPLQC
jgi:hypothetical protein